MIRIDLAGQFISPCFKISTKISIVGEWLQFYSMFSVFRQKLGCKQKKKSIHDLCDSENQLFTKFVINILTFVKINFL